MKERILAIVKWIFGGAKRVRTFHYTAEKADGSPAQGTVKAKDAAAAANQVLDMGLHPREVRRSPGLRGTFPVCDAKDGLVTRWRLAREDGHVAVWKPSRSGRVFSAGVLVMGLGVLVGVWFLLSGDPWDEGPALVIVFFKFAWWVGRVMGTLIGLLFLTLGIAGLLARGELRVDGMTGRLVMQDWGRLSLGREEVREIAVERRYQKFSDCDDYDTAHLALMPTVRVIGKDGSAEVLEQCHSEKHAVALGTKVAEYLNVPCHNTL